MQISKIEFGKIKALSYKDVFYQTNTTELKDFFEYYPDLDGLHKALERRRQTPVNRGLLQEVWLKHYQGMEISKLQKEYLDAIKYENTFTVVTAHQPCILGGPAYYIYKICSIIHLTRTLKSKYPNDTFVPVFISGSEDHDFDEVKNIHLFNRTLTWETNQSGPVGRFSTDGLDAMVDEISNILGNGTEAQKLSSIWKDSLQKSENYNDFVFYWLNELFKDEGLLVLNMDDHSLKKSFVPIFEKEIVSRKSESLVWETQEKLLTLNFKPQAFARDVNIFYLKDQSRERIYFENGQYKVNNTSLSFTEAEILSELHTHPENFSPNVILRPLYQEFCLPNIAYIGGGGEIAYWLERKPQFEYFQVFYPVLIRRNSVMILPKAIQKTMEKWQISEDDLLLDEDALVHKYLENSTDISFQLTEEIQQLDTIFKQISEKAKFIDATLEPLVLAEASKLIKATENIESRLKRSLKQKEETAVNQLKSIKSKLFPNQGLQERHDSFFQFMVSENEGFLSKLIEVLDPLEKEFLFIYL